MVGIVANQGGDARIAGTNVIMVVYGRKNWGNGRSFPGVSTCTNKEVHRIVNTDKSGMSKNVPVRKK